MSLINKAYESFLQECQTGTPLVFHYASPVTKEVKVSLEYETSRDQKSMVAYASVDSVNNRLLVHFLRYSICPSQWQLFAANEFRFAGKCSLSFAATRALGFTQGRVFIRQGSYPTLTGKHFLTISVPIELREDTDMVSFPDQIGQSPWLQEI